MVLRSLQFCWWILFLLLLLLLLLLRLQLACSHLCCGGSASLITEQVAMLNKHSHETELIITGQPNGLRMTDRQADRQTDP